MSPPSGAIKSAHVEATPAAPSAETGTALVSMEQFIWGNATAPAETAEPEGNELDNQEATSEASDDNDEALTRIVVLSEDEEETGDSWRRQLISALRDADRDASQTKSRPTEPPPIPSVERRRRSPNALVENRPARIGTPAPIVRTPRHRIGLALLGIPATVILLSTTLPHAANTPEMAAVAAASETFVTGSLAVPTAGEDTLKPVILNSPVLIREGMSRSSASAVPVGPVIETVRTVPVQIGARPAAGVRMSGAAPAVDQPAAPLALPQPPPAPAPQLDRERLAALIYDEPAAPAEPGAAAAPPPATPAPVASKEPPASVPPAADKAKTRSPQVSTAYQRSIRAAPHAKRTSKKRAQTKTASRPPDRGKWETRRQGLRTSPPPNEVKEVAPSTMVKILKALNPFASKEEPQANASAPARKNIFK